MVRQAAMVVKCVLLMYYRNIKGRHYHRQDLDISQNLVLFGVDLKGWLLRHYISPSEMLHFYS
uniref:Uncharacterized protein n=1 Tax=Triticum aestivum TaxID=4565 RepID=A0A077S016_WHEAT|nr:unnamed protein product [Triticum aestivum]